MEISIMILLGPCLMPILFAFAQCDNAHNTYQQGYDQGIHFTTYQIIILAVRTTILARFALDMMPHCGLRLVINK
jgi:hypothetical protein